jgi:hypothetical protein
MEILNIDKGMRFMRGDLKEKLYADLPIVN